MWSTRSFTTSWPGGKHRLSDPADSQSAVRLQDAQEHLAGGLERLGPTISHVAGDRLA